MSSNESYHNIKYDYKLLQKIGEYNLSGRKNIEYVITHQYY